MLSETNDCQFKAKGYNFKTLILNEKKNHPKSKGSQ